ncbi:MAG: transaldolase [Gemmatimonadetes bacterium]|nr:transaldolase [Gemmatimonadota bacterium]MYH17891.1 transaldolase [Gemmatimonadota bacterium]
MANPLNQLERHGQSFWLDSISRELMYSGRLRKLIEEDGLKGMTSNPAIFEKAIAGSTDYDADIERLAAANRTALEIYETLAISDIREAADHLAVVYEATGGADGFVSLEVSPELADDTEGTIEEARRLWKAVDRPNVMIKVPATEAGVPAVRQLIGEGLNINVTLMFSRAVYEAVADAYISGLEDRLAAGGEISGIASVSSFFISRIDTLVDALLAERAERAGDPGERAAILELIGKTAIANGKTTYQRYKTIYTSPRWSALAEKGARKQRLLWASTSTKNPEYRDVLYVEELIGKNTINTLPDETLVAFRDHGRLADTLEAGIDEAWSIMAGVENVGISMDRVSEQLVEEGVRKFVDPFVKLIEAIERKRLQPVRLA